MNISILYGTETGNAENVAQEVAQALAEQHTVQVRDLDDCGFDALHGQLSLVVLSTYGEGDFPRSATRFAEQLESVRPDLSGVRYAVFGLGDSHYAETFGRASERFDALLHSLGASRVAERHLHDASKHGFPEDAAQVWLEAVLENVSQSCT